MRKTPMSDDTKRIMVVDDEYDIVHIVRKHLERWGYSVDTFTDPLFALRIFEDNPDRYSIILTDIRMPEMSGVALAKVMKANLERFLSGLILRQMPLVVASLVTGALLIYWLGFWTGIIVNTIGWGVCVFAVKAYAGKRRKSHVDSFKDEKFLVNFLLALIGRK